ncbi:ATP-binding protein [Streptomyces sp. NPDC092307]|uniref:ATP-binding protein n=1 Tax=Streptomyces sp. NPDC092307 TaxID=3366013 RepID=UPI00381E15AD
MAALFVLPGESLRSPSAARRIVVDLISTWDVVGDAFDRLLVITSELVTNSVQHSTSVRIVLGLELLEDSVRVSVSDQGPSTGIPIQPHRGSVDSVSGRGLTLVDGFSARWGTERTHRGGTTIWAVVVLPDRRTRGGWDNAETVPPAAVRERWDGPPAVALPEPG